LAYPYIILIRYLNSKYQWKNNVIKRFIFQFIVAIFAGLLVTPFILIPAGILFNLEYDFQTIINNAYYMVMLSLFLFVILEAVIFFEESLDAKIKAQHLEKELSQIRFEVLKSQINPHFMFNSLNVLSGLVNKDPYKAQQFIDEFSHIYRYVLETIEQPVSKLNKELDFMRSYFFLQQIRYGENLTYSLNIPSELLDLVLPPLSLQVVLENAIKHNIVNENKPLNIEIYNEDSFLLVKNNIQPKISLNKSTGLGLKNLIKRYALICELKPKFFVENQYYIAKLPLIKTDCDESNNN
jgi:LytS/YehU family sensor histidine kinase